MKKKTSIVLILILSVSILITAVPQFAAAATPTVKMGAVALTADNVWHAYNSKKPTISGWTAGKYRLSKDGKTLELNGIKYSGSKRGIYSSAAITIKTTGTNTFTCNGARGIGIGPDDYDLRNLTLTGTSGSVLNLKCTNARAICVNTCTFSTITVNATGPLYCETNYNGNSGKMAVTGNFEALGNTTIGGGTLSISGTTSVNANYKQTAGTVSSGKAMDAYGNTTIGGGTLTVGGDFYTNAYSISAGTMTSKACFTTTEGFTGTGGTLNVTKKLYVGGNMTLNGANVTASTEGVTATENLNVAKGTLTAKSTIDDVGVYVGKNLTVSGTGKVAATAGNTCSFNIQGTLSISGGTIEATNAAVPKDNMAYANLWAESMVVTGGTITAKATGAAGDAITSNGSFKMSGGSVVATTVNAENNWYPIRIQEETTISGGTVAATNNSYSNGIYSAGNMTVSGSADVTAKSAEGAGIYSASEYLQDGGRVDVINESGHSGMYISEKVHLRSGQLSVKGGLWAKDILVDGGVLKTETCDSYDGIYGTTITINDGIVEAVANDTEGTFSADGIYAQDIEINGGTVRGEGTVRGVYAWGSLRMTDGKLTGITSSSYSSGIECGNPETTDIADDIWISDPSNGYTSLQKYVSSDYYNFQVYESDGSYAKEVTLQKVRDISVKKGPVGPFYEDDIFDPLGMVLDVTFADNSTASMEYNWYNEDLFTFGIEPGTVLTTGTHDTTVEAFTKTAIMEFAVKTLGTATVRGTTTSDTATLNWDAADGANIYWVFAKKGDSSEFDFIGSTFDLTYTDTDLSPGDTAEYYILAVRYTSSNKVNRTRSNTITLTTALTAPKVEAKDVTYNSNSFAWTAERGAEAYRIYRSEDEVQYDLIATTEETEFTDTELTTGVQYIYYVVAVNETKGLVSPNSNLIYGTPVFTGKPVLTVTNNKKNYDLEWTEVDGATGYEIWRGNDKNGARTKLVTIEGTTFNDISADCYTTYNYVVKPVRVVGDNTFHATESDKVIAVEIIKDSFTDKEIDDAPVDKNIKKISKIKTIAYPSKKSMRIEFEKVSGAYDYRIEFRKRGDKKWKKKWTGKKNNMMIKGMKKGQFLEFRFAAYKYKNGKLRRGAYSKIGYRWYVKTTAKVKAGKQSINVKFKKYKGATGYKVYYADVKKPNKVKSKQSAKTNIKITGLKKGHTYIVRYRPIKKIGSVVYEGMSVEKKIKVK